MLGKLGIYHPWQTLAVFELRDVGDNLHHLFLRADEQGIGVEYRFSFEGKSHLLPWNNAQEAFDMLRSKYKEKIFGLLKIDHNHIEVAS